MKREIILVKQTESVIGVSNYVELKTKNEIIIKAGTTVKVSLPFDFEPVQSDLSGIGFNVVLDFDAALKGLVVAASDIRGMEDKVLFVAITNASAKNVTIPDDYAIIVVEPFTKLTFHAVNNTLSTGLLNLNPSEA